MEIRLALKVFLVGIIIGSAYAFVNFKEPKQFLDLINTAFEEGLNLPKDNFWAFFIYIFPKNVVASLIAISLGLIHKSLPLGIALFNGGFMGIIITCIFMFNLGAEKLLLLIPHGIFEIPAFLMAVALGVSLTTRSENFKDRFNVLLKSQRTLFLILFLLLIAGIIESGLIVLGS